MAAFLGEAETSDADSVGSKAATLSRLALRYDVPPGFCLEAAVFDRLSGAVAGDERARSELRALVADGLERLEARVGRAPVAVAVRSSAIGEDGSDASFAGQHDTVLGVHGVDAIADAVLRCWRSVSDERALAYRREKGIDGPPRIAVLVQEFVEADVAAIAFTSDPVSGDRDRVVVNASWGLGETIASGAVTPDIFTLRKADLALLSTEVSDKRVMAQRRDGTVVEIPVPEERRTRAALDEEAVRGVARLALDLEKETGGPVDVECAFVAGRLVLLQSRPITALVGEAEFPVRWSDPADAELTWHRDEAHHGEHAPPLSVDYVVEGPGAGVRGRARILGQPTLVLYQAQNGWIYFGGRHLVEADQLPQARAVAEARVRDLSRRLPDIWRDDYLPSVRAHYAWMRSLALDAISGAGAAALWNELWRRVNDIWTTHMLVVTGAYSAVDELARAYTQLTGRPDAEALELVQGRAMTLQRMQAELHRLVEELRREERLAAAIERGDVRSVEDVRALSGSAAAAPIEAFLADHGDVGQAFGDLGSPPWADDQPLLFDELARRLRSADGDPARRLEELLRRADSIAAATRTLLRDRPDDLARFEEALAVAQAAGPLTEEHNYWIDRFAQANVRRAVLAFGERLARDSQLGDPGQVFLFYIPEVRDALVSGRDLRPLARRRADQVRREARLRPPPIIRGTLAEGDALAGSRILDLNLRVPQSDPRGLKGIPASPGLGRGPVRIVEDPDAFGRFRSGEVLVCRSSNVSWVPLFAIAAAVVTEVGGALSHAAVVAREFGVPAVVGTGVALSELVDGQLVEVDGTAGLVRRLHSRLPAEAAGADG